MIDELISRVMATRDMAHIEHWRTKSYPAHMALGQFYEAIPGLLDELVECYIGQFGEIPPFQVQTKKGDITDRLEDDVDYMEAVRAEICQDNPSLENLLDTITACYQKTLYLLKRF